ncbi:MAG: DUF924 family protein [Cyanobacteria bacterium J06649_4]
MPAHPRVNDILAFWFGDLPLEGPVYGTDPNYGQYRKVWFIKNDAFDEQIRRHFLADVQKAAAGKYDDWQLDPESAVALLLLLDQFPRNLYRSDPRSFATDTKALAVAQALVETGKDKTLVPAMRFFVYVPFEHSENLAHQNRCIELMSGLNADYPALDKGLKNGVDYAVRHRDIIQRFGRFPHRNEVLGRESTPEEVAFLKQPGSRF